MTATAPARPLISVVVPTFDRLTYLKEAVASMRAQTHPDWELIVVDDGSTDDTREWILSLDDPRIQLLSLPHTGNLGHLCNEGIALAQGEFLAFLNPDDAFEPDKLEVQLAALSARPECGWSYTAFKRVDMGGQQVLHHGRRGWREISGWILEPLLDFDLLVESPTVMVRRDLLDKVGGLDEALSESQDYEFFFRLAAASQAVAISRMLTRKRIHLVSTSTNRLRVHEAWIEIYDRFGAASSDARIRSVCAKEARRHRIRAAAGRGRMAEPRRALAHLLPALRQRPLSARTWKVLLVQVLGHGVLLATLRRMIGKPASPPTSSRRHTTSRKER